jgi:hypothetical protein
MTKDDIIKMAQTAGLGRGYNGSLRLLSTQAHLLL